MNIQYKNVSIARIRQEHIKKCVALRQQQEAFFFQRPSSAAQSEQWILDHLANEDDCLLAICLVPSGAFVGTIGYQKTAQGYELGRLALCPKSLYQLIQSGHTLQDMDAIALHAGMALAYYLFENLGADTIYAQVMEHNRLSNHLFDHSMFQKSVETRNLSGQTHSVCQYKLTRGSFFNAFDEKVDILLT